MFKTTKNSDQTKYQRVPQKSGNYGLNGASNFSNSVKRAKGMEARKRVNIGTVVRVVKFSKSVDIKKDTVTPEYSFEESNTILDKIYKK